MTELFLKIINMSISASWLALVVLLLRRLFKKVPKWVNVLLWGITAIRLICPFSFESALSLIPSAETISPGIMMDSTPSVQTGIPAINNAINPVIGSAFSPAPVASANPLQIWIPILSVIWLTGVAVLLLYTAASYWRLRRKVSEAVILRDNIYQSENVASPFVLGVIKPKIYLPYQTDAQDLNHVLAHEQAHIRRRDHWWKPLGFLLLTIHWFNPLMWLAYVLLCRDIELACDEKVIKALGNEQRADYTQALVACSVNRRMIGACPLAFGEVGVKERVKSVMNYKKPAFWVLVLAIIVCAVVAVCFLTNPVTKEPDLSFLNYENAISLVADVDEVRVIYCPAADEGSDSMIQVGAASGSDLAKQLDRWAWKECSAPREALPSSGSVEFVIEEDYRITVHQRKPGSLRQYAVVQFQDDIRYYRIDKRDYTDAVALVHAPDAQGKVLGKTYLYEKEGILGHFQITLFNDGTFTYYEGSASSYIGIGTWQKDGNIITLKDDETLGYAFVNRFRLDGNSLVFIEKDSSNFIYVEVSDGERFNLAGEAFKGEDFIIDNSIPDLQGNNVTEVVGNEDAAFVPTETDVLNLRAAVLEGMSEREIFRLTDYIKSANLSYERAWFYNDIFDQLSDPENVYWSFFDRTGEIQIGWAENSDGTTSAVIAHNNHDAAFFINTISELKESVVSGMLDADLDRLIELCSKAKETRDVEYANEMYRMLHDLDYFLLRYGPADVGEYVPDDSTITKYYGSLRVWKSYAP